MKTSLFALFLFYAVSMFGQITVEDFIPGTYNGLPYRLFVPKEYKTSEKYPLVLFLHGAGQSGDNNFGQFGDPSAFHFAEDDVQNIQKCFVLVPHCPFDAKWVNTPWESGTYNTDKIAISEQLLDVVGIIGELKKGYSIDETRLYVTGLSMGGYGTWDLIIRYPNMFAAAIPICGAGDPSKASTIKHIPIWAFHSSDDPTVPVSGTREMAEALTNAGDTDFKYTEYNNLGHDCWATAYSTDGIDEWLFAQKLTSTMINEAGINDVRVFPNPFKEKINIQTDGLQKIELFSVNGSKLFETIDNATINTVNYPSGLYILKTTNKSACKTTILVRY